MTTKELCFRQDVIVEPFMLEFAAAVQELAACKEKGIESERLYCHKEIVLPGQPVTSRLAVAS